MLTDVKFKGLYSGRLAYVEYPEVVGFQILGVVFLKFIQELNSVLRSQLISLLQKAKKDEVVISFVLIFPESVELSGVDLNMFREIYLLLSGSGSQFSIVCGNEEMEKLNTFSKTKAISVYSSLTEALVNTKSQYLKTFGSTLTRNIMVYDSDLEQRNSLVDHLRIDRFSAFGVPTTKEAKDFLSKFGAFLDGAIFEVTNPDLKEFKLIEQFRSLKPDAKILIHTETYDAKILETCKKNNITCVIKSPFKPLSLIRKFKLEFPERHSNYLGFSE